MCIVTFMCDIIHKCNTLRYAGKMAANERVVSGDLAAEEQPPTASRKNRGKKKKAPGAQV